MKYRLIGQLGPVIMVAALLCLAATTTYKALMVSDSNVCAQAVTFSTDVGFSHADGLSANTIGEYSAASGVTVDGVLLKDSTVTVVDAIYLKSPYFPAAAAASVGRGVGSAPVIVFNDPVYLTELLGPADALTINGSLKITDSAITDTAGGSGITFLGAVLGYGTVYIDAGAMVPCTTAPAASGTNEYATDKAEMDYFAFDGGATEERIQFKMVLPNDWNAGTVKVKLHWSSATGSTAGDTVEWSVKAISLANDGTIATAFGTEQVISDTLLADSGAKMQTTGATPAITIASATAGAVTCFEVYRNTSGTDDMAEDAWLFGLEIQYTKSTTAAAGW